MQHISSANLNKVIKHWRRQKTRLLVLAGRRKSGKDVLTDYIIKHYQGFKHYRIADAPAMIAKILELPVDREILHKLFELNAIFRSLLGTAAYLRRVSILLDRERPKLAIVEAVRNKEEYEEFVIKRKGILIGVAADDKIRYGRALKDAKNSRGKRDEGRMTFKEFVRKEKSPIEREIDWIVERAHFVIDNSHKTKRPFYEKADKVMVRLGFKRIKKKR